MGGCLPCFRSSKTDPLVEQHRQYSADDGTVELGVMTLTYPELKTATNSFTIRLGKGGRTYRGTLERNQQSTEIAVKRLNLDEHEFQRVVVMLEVFKKDKNPNIANLIGYCPGGDSKYLVYDFMPLGSLDNLLYGSRSNRVLLGWGTRMKIAADVAKGLEFLHGKEFVYRALKSANVLLGTGFHAILSDLELAKNINVEESGGASGSTRARVQAKEYGAPEYHETGNHTLKSDVYSYGVLLLEVITGTKPVEKREEDNDGTHRLDGLRELLSGNKTEELMNLQDGQRNGEFPEAGLKTAVEVVVMCCQKEPQARPDMKRVMNIMNKLAAESKDTDSTRPAYQQGESSKGESAFEKGESSKGNDLDEVKEEIEEEEEEEEEDEGEDIQLVRKSAEERERERKLRECI